MAATRAVGAAGFGRWNGRVRTFWSEVRTRLLCSFESSRGICDTTSRAFGFGVFTQRRRCARAGLRPRAALPDVVPRPQRAGLRRPGGRGRWRAHLHLRRSARSVSPSGWGTARRGRRSGGSRLDPRAQHARGTGGPFRRGVGRRRAERAEHPPVGRRTDLDCRTCPFRDSDLRPLPTRHRRGDRRRGGSSGRVDPLRRAGR